MKALSITFAFFLAIVPTFARESAPDKIPPGPCPAPPTASGSEL